MGGRASIRGVDRIEGKPCLRQRGDAFGEALEVYRERVDHLAGAGGDRQYAEAATLVARMGILRGHGVQAAYVADLKARFGRKRNFMKLLADRSN